MVVSLLLAVPALAGLWLLTGGRSLSVTSARRVAAVSAAATLALAVGVAVSRPDVDLAWVPELGLRWSLGVDGISVPLVLLTALVGVLVAAHAWVEMPGGGSPATFLGCLLLVEAGALATFTARDAILFFIAFEVVLVPIWVLIGRFGDSHDLRARKDAAARFVLYTAAGSTLMLVGILTLVAAAGTSDLRELAAGGAASVPADRQLLVAALLVAGLAVKVPVFPLHTWLPPAHTIAPTAGSVLLAAVLLKMGTYGLVRLPVSTVPDGFASLSPVLAVLGVVGIIWGALVCLVERDLKRLIAYSSVAHMGFVVLALSTGSQTGLQAALFANIAHGVVAALLFVLVGGLKQRWGSRRPGRGATRAARDVTAAGLRADPRTGGEPRPAGAGRVLGGVPRRVLRVVAGRRPTRGLFVACAVVAAVGAALAAAYALRVARVVWVGDRPEPGSVGTPDTVGVERCGSRRARRGRRDPRCGARPPVGADGRCGRQDRGWLVSAVVSFDALVLAPALLPALGVVLVLVVDAVVPGRRTSWAPCTRRRAPSRRGRPRPPARRSRTTVPHCEASASRLRRRSACGTPVRARARSRPRSC